MVRQLLFRAACIGASLVCGQMSAWAVVATWDEAVNGEITNERTNPLVLNLGAGVNTIKGTMGILEEGHDLEYLQINMPTGHKLAAILMQAYDGGLDVDTTAFVGVQAGPIFTFDHNDAFSNIGNMLGWAHFGLGQDHLPGEDILQDLGTGGQGFTGPLTGPQYTFWIQQTGGTTTYQLGFVVVPEPSTACLLGVAACGAAGAVRRRRVRLA